MQHREEKTDNPDADEGDWRDCYIVSWSAIAAGGSSDADSSEAEAEELQTQMAWLIRLSVLDTVVTLLLFGGQTETTAPTTLVHYLHAAAPSLRHLAVSCADACCVWPSGWT